MSKGLERLARIKGHFNPKDIANKELFEEDFNTIEQELKDYYALKKECEKAKWYQEHKALKIIKKKGIDYRKFLESKNCDEYNEPIIRYNLIDIKPYTKEEYDLLKEMLLW